VKLKLHYLNVPNVMEIWEPKHSGTLWATLGLLRESFTFLTWLEFYYWIFPNVFLVTRHSARLSYIYMVGIVQSVEARFSAPVQTGPGAHPASYTMGTESLPGVKWPGYGVDHPLLLVPRLKKEYSYTSTPPLSLRGLF